MTKENESLVSMSHITKSYQLGKTEVKALRDINLTLNKGEFAVCLGPSGSGKSTLLNLLGCLDTPTSGQYFLENKDVSKMSRDELADIRNSRIGFIFQSFNLIPVLDVAENIELPCLLRQRAESRADLRQRVTAIAEQVGLGSVLRHKPDELSGGQRQRVAIARALATEPLLILADEPTANLDSKTSAQILDLMWDLNAKNGVTFLFATHDPRVMERARRTVHIQDGCMGV